MLKRWCFGILEFPPLVTICRTYLSLGSIRPFLSYNIIATKYKYVYPSWIADLVVWWMVTVTIKGWRRSQFLVNFWSSSRQTQPSPPTVMPPFFPISSFFSIEVGDPFSAFESPFSYPFSLDPLPHHTRGTRHLRLFSSQPGDRCRSRLQQQAQPQPWQQQ